MQVVNCYNSFGVVVLSAMIPGVRYRDSGLCAITPSAYGPHLANSYADSGGTCPISKS